MIPRRRYYRRRGYKSYKRYKYGRGNTWASNAPALARTALKTAKWVAGLVNTEFKQYDKKLDNILSFSNLTPPFNSLIPLTDISQGDDYNNRNGRSIKAKSLQVRYVVKFPTTSTADHVAVRLVIVMVKDLNSTTIPLASDIYEYDGTTSGTKAQMVNAFRNNENNNARNFKVLMDKRVTLDKDYKSEIVLTKYLKLGHHIRWVGTTGGSFSYGHLFQFYIVDNDVTTTATNEVQVVAQSRFKYVDN